jgi:hypothetical protein
MILEIFHYFHKFLLILDEKGFFSGKIPRFSFTKREKKQEKINNFIKKEKSG